VTALAPLFVMLALYLFGRLPKWVMAVYGYAFAICAIGWEIWYTYGLVGGLPVNERRAPAISEAIPLHLNWVLTSLFDASICVIALYLVWLRRELRPMSAGLDLSTLNRAPRTESSEP